jgi:hypothetical protein
MTRSILRKAALPLLAAALTALVLSSLGQANHIGFLNLGHTNTANDPTELTGSISAPELRVVNGSDGAGVRGQSKSGKGVYGLSDDGTGVLGIHNGLTGTQPGVQGDTSSTAATAVGVYGHVTSERPGGPSAGVFGENEGSGSSHYGVWGVVAGSGNGVTGHAPTGKGVFGSSAQGTGVRGFSGSGIGVQADGGYYGVEALTNDIVGRAVYAHHDGSSTGYGVYATTDLGTAVFSQSDAGTGVSATGAGTTGVGVSGKNSTSTNHGALGLRLRGAEGVALNSNGIGVYGQADNGSSSVGVYGTSLNGYAGRFIGNVRIDGNLNVVGTVTKGGGAFRIDHPLDPQHRYLQHSFVESPEMMNVYNGNVRTDSRGFAVVQLPRWFQALNRNFRYQLTPIGAFAQAIVWKKIAGNRFTVRTSKPHVEVSWQVTGVRHDRWANTHRVQVEVPKTAR